MLLFFERGKQQRLGLSIEIMYQRSKCVSALFYTSVTTPAPQQTSFFLPPFLHAYIQAFNQFIDWFGESLRNSAKQNNKLWGSKSKCPVLSPSPLYFCVHWNDKWEEGENLVHALVFLIATNISSRVFRLFMSNAPISKILFFNNVCREIQKM